MMIISLKDMVKLADTILKLVEMYEETVPDNPDSTTAKRPDWLAEGMLLAYDIKLSKSLNIRSCTAAAETACVTCGDLMDELRQFRANQRVNASECYGFMTVISLLSDGEISSGRFRECLAEWVKGRREWTPADFGFTEWPTPDITGSSYQDENGNPRLPNMPPVEEVLRKLKKEVATDKELIKKLEHKIMILGGSSIPGL